MILIPPLTTGAVFRMKPVEVQEAISLRQRMADCTLAEAMKWWNELVARCQKAMLVDEATLATQLVEMASEVGKEEVQ